MSIKSENGDILAPNSQRVFVFLMFFVCLFDFADRAVFAVLAQTIKTELLLTDLQLGLLQGLAFAFLYSMLGLPLARVAERKSRVTIMAVCTAVWSAATLFCGFATSFSHLAIGRIGVGVGEAGFIPTVNSMVGDRFKRNQRASVMGLIMLGTPAGILTGSLVGGYFAEAFDWRYAFYILGAAGLIVALVVYIVIREPSRGLADGSPPSLSPPPDFPAFLKALRSKPSLMLIIAGGSTAGFGMTSISQFLAVFLARTYDMPVREAAVFYGFTSAAFLTIGLMIGSFGTDFLAKRDERWPAWGAAIGLTIAPFFYFAAFNVHNIFLATILLIIAGSMLLIFYAPTSGMIQNLLQPRMRATGAAMFAMLYTMIGSGLGPTFIGGVSDLMATVAFDGDFHASCPGGVALAGANASAAAACLEASALGIQRALNVAVCIFFAAALLYFLASRKIRDDFYTEGKSETVAV
ncbi:spinster family MFS transporter [Marinicaulis aureus]|uniref:Spinster family MFS transporter n=1 Tax=Hyphococcus aureus TaxID=2666033 RepID=A0ABW1KYH9_9PROT